MTEDIFSIRTQVDFILALECNPEATCEDLINGIVFWWANFESVVRNSECGFRKEILGEDGFFRLTLFVAPGGLRLCIWVGGGGSPASIPVGHCVRSAQNEQKTSS